MKLPLVQLIRNYLKKPPSEQRSGEEASFLQDEHETALIHAQATFEDRWRTLGRWTALNLLLLILFTSINVVIWLHPRKVYWPTELADARKAIEYEERRFSGALVYDEAKGKVTRLHDAEVEYFGPPTPDIERAWVELLRGEFPIFSDEEATQFKPQLLPLPFDGKYHFELDVFHSLHCLNGIRKTLNHVLYNTTKHGGSHHDHIIELLHDPSWTTVHAEHCMDQIRQIIMCHGDMTPVPIYTWPGFPLSLGRTDKHTCRRFDKIRSWLDHRAENGFSLQFQSDRRL